MTPWKLALIGSVAFLVACGNNEAEAPVSEAEAPAVQTAETSPEETYNSGTTYESEPAYNSGSDYSESPAAAAKTIDTVLGLTFTEGYIRAPLKGRDVAAGYFVVENSGDPIAMLSASSPVAETVELHTHTMDGGVMKMREVERVDLPAGETVTFEPGGLHLMMFGFAAEEGQTQAPVTITLDNGETLDVLLPIRER